jgi:outer membrane protein W
MIKMILLTIFGTCAFLAAQAQDSLQVKPQASAPYKLAVGFRYSPNGPRGADLGIAAKYFIGRESALEAYSGVNPESNLYLASLSYIWQPQLLTSQRFRPYVGIGAGYMRTRNLYFDEGTIHSSAVAVASIGMEYNFKKAPIAISLDYRTALFRLGGGLFTAPNIGYVSNTGFGIKYTFR